MRIPSVRLFACNYRNAGNFIYDDFQSKSVELFKNLTVYYVQHASHEC